MHEDHTTGLRVRYDLVLRGLATCGLIILTGILFWYGYHLCGSSSATAGNILYSVSAGILVLALAIWVSYFAERSAVSYMQDRVDKFNTTLVAEVNKLEQGVSLLATGKPGNDGKALAIIQRTGPGFGLAGFAAFRGPTR